MIAYQDQAACWRILRCGSKSFALATYLLPKAIRPAVVAIYAFCRQADDAADHQQDGHFNIDLAPKLPQNQELWINRLDGIFANCPGNDAVDRALAAVVKTYALPKHLFLALLEGFAWDRQRRSYPTLTALYAYAARVAGSVGTLMALLMQQKHPLVLARACELGIAMQLSNIARDVADDAAIGRVYLPEEWLHAVGLSAKGLKDAFVYDFRLAQVIEQLLQVSDTLYKQARLGINHLPRRYRWGILAAAWIYADINRIVRLHLSQRHLHRAVVSVPRKLALVGAAWYCTWQRHRPITQALPQSTLHEVEFLLQDGSKSV